MTHNARETRRPHPKFLAIPRYSWFFRVLPNFIGLLFRRCARNSPHMRGTTNEQTRGCRRGAQKCARWCALQSVGAGSDRGRLRFYRWARNSPHMQVITNEQTRRGRGNCGALRSFAVLCGHELLQSRSRARNSPHTRVITNDQTRRQRGNCGALRRFAALCGHGLLQSRSCARNSRLRRGALSDQLRGERGKTTSRD